MLFLFHYFYYFISIIFLLLCPISTFQNSYHCLYTQSAMFSAFYINQKRDRSADNVVTDELNNGFYINPRKPTVKIFNCNIIPVVLKHSIAEITKNDIYFFILL